MMAVEMVPTQYAIRMRPVFMCLFVLLMGAFCLSGEYGINVMNCLLYAIVAVISGIFDVIACIMYFQHSKYKIFDTSAPAMVLIAQAVFLLSPVILFASGMLSYSIYGDCRNNSTELEEAPMYGGGVNDGGGPTYQAMRRDRQQPRSVPPPPQNF